MSKLQSDNLKEMNQFENTNVIRKILLKCFLLK